MLDPATWFSKLGFSKRVTFLFLLLTGVFLHSGTQCAAQTTVLAQTTASLQWIIQSPDGRLYAVDPGVWTTCVDGYGNCGAIHQLAVSSLGTYDFIEHTFNPTLVEGGAPGNLLVGPDGNVWGTTGYGGPAGSPPGKLGCSYDAPSSADGCGTFFDGEITTSPQYLAGLTQVLHPFTFLEGGQGGFITLGSDGNYYGVNALGAESATSQKAMYVVTPAGQYTQLAKTSADTDGSGTPYTPLLGGEAVLLQLLEADDGNLYGLSGESAESINPRNGAFYSMSKRGVVNYLATFGPDSADDGYPAGQLVEGPDQAFYGVAGEPGNFCFSSVCGTVFRATKSGQVTIIHTFTTAEGFAPAAGLWLGSDGVLYGTTYYGGDTTKCPGTYPGCGTLFSIHTDGSNFQVLHTFEGGADGAHPYSLVQGGSGATAGILYGTAGSDGVAGSPAGVIFQTILPSQGSVPVPSPVQVQVLKASDLSPVTTNTPIPVNTPLIVKWQVLNAFSNTMQKCGAFVNGTGTVDGWSGYQSGSLTNSVYSGEASVTISTADTYSLALTCGGVESGASDSITVSDTLRIETATLPNATVNQSYSLALAVDGGSSPYAFAITAGSLPTGITLDAKTGLLSGKPTQFGSSSFTVQVTDSSATPVVVTANLSLTVQSSLSITTASLPTAHLNQAYSQTIDVTGGIPPYAYAVITGALPNGLTLDPAKGTVSGTATKAGTFHFTISVNDSESPADSKTQAYTLIVAADTLVVTTTSLPAAGVGTSYNVPFMASGGVPPYVWILVSGNTPKGLIIDSTRIGGTPQQFGPGQPFTVQVSDAETPAQTATATFTLPVQNTLNITSTTLPTATVGKEYSAQVGVSGGLSPFTWSAGANLEKLGLAIDPATGIISGTPTVAGSYQGGVSVKDSEGTPATDTVNIIIPITGTQPGITTTTISSSNANPAAGQAVTFTAHVNSSVTATGMVTFTTGTTVLGAASLNTNNVAMFTASFNVAGTYAVSASYAGDASNQASVSKPVVETVLAPQAITFAALANQAYGSSPLTLAATASSHLPVSFTVAGPASLTGSVLTITGTGMVAVTANQAGNQSYAAAPAVTQSFNVTPAVLTVAANNASRAYGAANPSFTYTVSGFKYADTVAVVGGAATLSTTANPTSPAGSTWPITFLDEGLAAANYTFLYVPGTLTITAGGTQPIGPPSFSSPGGTYDLPQVISLASTTEGAAFFYTLDGSVPTMKSTPYAGAIIVARSATVSVKAFMNGAASAVASQHYTINRSDACTLVDYSQGFDDGRGFEHRRLSLNEGAAITNGALQLTDGNAFEGRSAFVRRRVPLTGFTTEFTFQLLNAHADGFTFTVQADSPNAVGQNGGGLGYAGLAKSAAVKFDLYSNAGEGSDSTGVYTDGAYPAQPSIDLSSTGIDLHSGHIFVVTLVYVNQQLSLTIRDTVTNAEYTKAGIALEMPGETGWVGFTAGTGSEAAAQNILAWAYTATHACRER